MTILAAIEIDPDAEFDVYGDTVLAPVEVIGHREDPWMGRVAKIRHLGPVPAGGARVYEVHAEDVIVEVR